MRREATFPTHPLLFLGQSLHHASVLVIMIEAQALETDTSLEISQLSSFCHSEAKQSKMAASMQNPLVALILGNSKAPLVVAFSI